MSRRAVVGGSLVVTAAAATGALLATDRLDDTLQAVWVRPTPLPDPADQRLVAQARAEAEALVAAAQRSSAPAAVVTALREHVDALPASASPPTVELPRSLATACDRVADARGGDALAAVSPEVSVVMASIAASLDQCARAVRTA